MSERAMQAGMQFSIVTSTSTSQHQQQPRGQVQATAAAGAAAGGTTTTTASTIPVTEPIPVLVGMTREVALQRLQDLARVSSSDLTGVAGRRTARICEPAYATHPYRCRSQSPQFHWPLCGPSPPSFAGCAQQNCPSASAAGGPSPNILSRWLKTGFGIP